MFSFFQKETPEQLKAQAKANYEKAAALKSTSRESASMRVRIALLAKAHLDSVFIEGAERTGTWQELCMLAIANGQEKPEAPTPSYFHRVKTQGTENHTYTWIPEELTDEVFGIGSRYQTVQVDAHQAIAMVQRIADEICQKDLKLDAPFKALQFLRDELEAAGETVNIPAGGGAAALGIERRRRARRRWETRLTGQLMLIFLTLVGAGLLALLVVVIYLNDRVNELERRSISSSMGSGWAGGNGNSGNADDNTWRGLTGKGLWDCMCGKQGASSLGAADVQALRLSYEGVLSQHIESLFRAGQNDAQRGATAQPTAVKTLASSRGNVQSWIPLNHANALYRAGMDSTKSDIYEAERARMTLDETAQTLYAQTGLTLLQPMSARLLGDGDSSSGGDLGEDGLMAAAPADVDPSTAGSLTPLPPPLPSGGMFSASTMAPVAAPTPVSTPAPASRPSA